MGWPRIRAVLGWRQTDQFMSLPTFYLRVNVVKSGWKEPLEQPWRKKKNYWSVWGCECLREHGQLWGWGKWGELTGDGRFIDSVFHEAWVFLAPIASITTSTCCLLEPWPSSSMGGLSHPAAEPSPEEPVA